MNPFQMALLAGFRTVIGAIFRAEIILLNCHPEHDDPNAVRFGHLDDDPKELHQDDRGVQRVQYLLEADEVVDVGVVAGGAVLQEPVYLDGHVGPHDEGKSCVNGRWHQGI